MGKIGKTSAFVVRVITAVHNEKQMKKSNFWKASILLTPGLAVLIPVLTPQDPIPYFYDTFKLKLDKSTHNATKSISTLQAIFYN